MIKRGKKFLNNSHEEHGSVSWHVTTGKDMDFYQSTCGGELRIADCYKVITLDFDCEKVSHVDKRIAKLDVLIQELQEMRAALEGVKEEAKLKTKFYY